MLNGSREFSIKKDAELFVLLSVSFNVGIIVLEKKFSDQRKNKIKGVDFFLILIRFI